MSHCRTTNMKDINVLQRHIQFILDRPFYLDKWIGDLTFLSILRTDFNLFSPIQLPFVEMSTCRERYMNKHLQNDKLSTINCFQYLEERLIYDNKTVWGSYFYYFSRNDKSPKLLSKEMFTIICYFSQKSMRIKNKVDEHVNNLSGKRILILNDIAWIVIGDDCFYTDDE